MAWNVVIAGGGFGGFFAAKTLEHVLPAHSAKVTLVNDTNFMLYTPLLPGAAGGTLEPRHVVVPLREELRRTDLRVGTVVGADPARKVLRVCSLEGRAEELAYDQLVVALGSVSRTLPIPGLAEHGIGFKTLPEAIALRNRMLRCLEAAEAAEDPAERTAYLTFVFVGAGYAGVEGLAELQDFAADAISLYPRAQTHGLRFVLVEARDTLMPEVGESLSAYATRELRARGIEVRASTTLDEVTERTARLSDGEVLGTRTVVWTAGVKAHPIVGEMGLPLDERGRVRVDARLAVEGIEGVWALGDCAAVPDPDKGGREPCPPTAQHALRQGYLAGRNVAAALGNGRFRRFTYKTLGVFVDMGRHRAVAQTMGIKWRGGFAWFLARTYHIAAMPGLKRRVRLLADWNVGLFFGRDASELGQLGHPAALEGVSSGGTRGDGTNVEGQAPQDGAPFGSTVGSSG